MLEQVLKNRPILYYFSPDLLTGRKADSTHYDITRVMSCNATKTKSPGFAEVGQIFLHRRGLNHRNDMSCLIFEMVAWFGIRCSLILRVIKLLALGDNRTCSCTSIVRHRCYRGNPIYLSRSPRRIQIIVQTNDLFRLFQPCN